MCSHYQIGLAAKQLADRLKIIMPQIAVKNDMWPKYTGAFIRAVDKADPHDEAIPDYEVRAGHWGMIPPWSADGKVGSTFNARSETAATKPTFRDAWRKNQRCIIPAEAIFEPDWRTGKAVPARIVRKDGEPMGIAGLWSAWRNPNGQIVDSYTMLTINADHHELMRQFHKPTDEKRMVVILPESSYEGWLADVSVPVNEYLSLNIPLEQI